ncbi:MAG: hypothetical protein QM737_07305 [Ferruginibacter sp.]
MKKIKLAVLALILFAGTSFGQGKSAGWAEQKAFHSFMAATFHPAEDGDLKPLKAKADSLAAAARLWAASPIPADYKPAETHTALKKLVEQCANISAKVKANASDADLTKLISEAHDTFHKIAGECKKPADGHEGHNH